MKRKSAVTTFCGMNGSEGVSLDGLDCTNLIGFRWSASLSALATAVPFGKLPGELLVFHSDPLTTPVTTGVWHAHIVGSAVAESR